MFTKLYVFQARIVLKMTQGVTQADPRSAQDGSKTILKSSLCVRFRVVWEPFLTPSWAPLWPSWALLTLLGATMQRPWPILRFSKGTLGPSRAILGPSWVNLVPLGSSLGPSGHFLGPLWVHFRAMLGPCWVLIGVMLKPYGGLSWEHPSLC